MCRLRNIRLNFRVEAANDNLRQMILTRSRNCKVLPAQMLIHVYGTSHPPYLKQYRARPIIFSRRQGRQNAVIVHLYY